MLWQCDRKKIKRITSLL